MTTKEIENTIIGLWTDFESSHLITIKEFAEQLSGKYGKLAFSLKDYMDGRMITNLIWFKYDPYTGIKVSREAVKEYVIHINKNNIINV